LLFSAHTLGLRVDAQLLDASRGRAVVLLSAWVGRGFRSAVGVVKVGHRRRRRLLARPRPGRAGAHRPGEHDRVDCSHSAGERRSPASRPDEVLIPGEFELAVSLVVALLVAAYWATARARLYSACWSAGAFACARACGGVQRRRSRGGTCLQVTQIPDGQKGPRR
jgi:hypothetical protein